MDFLSVSKGGKFEDAKQPKVGEAAYPYTGPSGHECMPTVRSDARGPFGRNLPSPARSARRGARRRPRPRPSSPPAGSRDFAQAEAPSRGRLRPRRRRAAEPRRPRLVGEGAAGRGAEVRRCKLTNYCEALDQRHKEVTCQRWDSRSASC
jgi:hypothetical protein